MRLALHPGGRPSASSWTCTREETFVCNRVRHAIRTHIISWVRPDGTFAARKIECLLQPGRLRLPRPRHRGQGHGRVPAALSLPDNVDGDCLDRVHQPPRRRRHAGLRHPAGHVCRANATLTTSAAAHRRGPAGVPPQEPDARGLSSTASRKNENYSDTLQPGAWTRAMARHGLQPQARATTKTRPVPCAGAWACALFWYNTAVWPICLETSSCRMVLNQDGSIQLQTGETEIGQGCDTAFAQMAADAVGIPVSDVHVVSAQDTDVTPFGTGCLRLPPDLRRRLRHRPDRGALLRERILNVRPRADAPDAGALIWHLVDGRIIRKSDGRVLMTLGRACHGERSTAWRTAEHHHRGDPRPRSSPTPTPSAAPLPRWRWTSPCAR